MKDIIEDKPSASCLLYIHDICSEDSSTAEEKQIYFIYSKSPSLGRGDIKSCEYSPMI